MCVFLLYVWFFCFFVFIFVWTSGLVLLLPFICLPKACLSCLVLMLMVQCVFSSMARVALCWSSPQTMRCEGVVFCSRLIGMWLLAHHIRMLTVLVNVCPPLQHCCYSPLFFGGSHFNCLIDVSYEFSFEDSCSR